MNKVKSFNQEYKELRQDIEQAKAKLKQKEVYENFGQREVRKLQDKYGSLLSDYFSNDSEQARMALMAFNQWCMHYTG